MHFKDLYDYRMDYISGINDTAMLEKTKRSLRFVVSKLPLNIAAVPRVTEESVRCATSTLLYNTEDFGDINLVTVSYAWAISCLRGYDRINEMLERIVAVTYMLVCNGVYVTRFPSISKEEFNSLSSSFSILLGAQAIRRVLNDTLHEPIIVQAEWELNELCRKNVTTILSAMDFKNVSGIYPAVLYEDEIFPQLNTFSKNAALFMWALSAQSVTTVVMRTIAISLYFSNKGLHVTLNGDLRKLRAEAANLMLPVDYPDSSCIMDVYRETVEVSEEGNGLPEELIQHLEAEGSICKAVLEVLRLQGLASEADRAKSPKAALLSVWNILYKEVD